MTDTLPIVRKTLTVPIPPKAAFSVFTDTLQDWWPLESHSLSASEGKRPLGVTLEPRLHGRIVEHRHDGEMADWATITDWEPGRHVTLDWYVGRRRSEATRIDVTFQPAPDNSTRVTLTHSGFERLGPAGEAAAATYDEGWDLVLGERFLQACEGR